MAHEKVLSTSLCRGLQQWFLQNDYFKNLAYPSVPLFKTVDDFYRIDYPQGDMTSISISPVMSETESQPTKENGQISLEISFNLGPQREDRGEVIYSTIEAVRAQLLSNPVYIQQYLSKNYVPGLQFINGQNTTDYLKLNQQISSEAGSVSIRFILRYRIGILTNQQALWNKTGLGNSFFSPDEVVYNPIKTIDIQIRSSITSPIVAYTVTPSSGYQSTGTLFLPKNYTGNGILLGNNGIIYTEPLEQFVPIDEIKTLYVDTVDITYLSTGMLILAENAIAGYAAKLLGDDGTVYNVIYDGSDFTPIKKNVTGVPQSDEFPVGGTLITRIKPETGNAGILFGDDGNIYNVVIS